MIRFLLFLALLMVSGSGFSQPRQANPKPASWTPPITSIPREFVDATEFLLRHGLSDPRGSRFVQAEVDFIDSTSGAKRQVTTVGWLLVPHSKKVKLFLSTDGLLYRKFELKQGYDARSYVEEVTRPKEKVFPHDNQGQVTTVALLLVHGDTSLAEELSRHIKVKLDRQSFVTLASSYLVSKYQRAVGAHLAGDDALALEIANELSQQRDAFETEGKRVYGKDWVVTMSRPDMGGKAIVFKFLDGIKDLVTDSNRRLQGPKRPSLDFTYLKRLPVESRVAKLIDYLDEVRCPSMPSPWGVNLAGDPIVQALIKEGNVSVELLLKTMETDKRLTRSVSYYRDYALQRDLIRVQAAAFAAFRAIAQMDTFSASGGRPSVADLRAFWRKNHNLSPLDRWMQTLADDQAGSSRWMEAANRLFEPVPLQHLGSWIGMTDQKPGEPPTAIKGEPLRNRNNPSVSDLLARRALLLSQRGADELDSFELKDSLQLALKLDKWDATQSLTVLQITSRRVMAVSGPYDSILGWTGLGLSKVIERRWELGDKGAIDEYAKWIVTTEECAGYQDYTRILQPLVRFSAEPVMQEAAKQLFLGKGSKWNILMLARERSNEGLAETIAISPLLGLPPVREAIDELLSDKTVVGESWNDGDVVQVKVGTGTGGTGGHREKDPFEPPPGVRRAYRICDKMASALGRLKDAPKIKPYWPDEEKDRTILTLKTYLDQHTDDLPDVISWPYNWEDRPRRNRPAS